MKLKLSLFTALALGTILAQPTTALADKGPKQKFAAHFTCGNNPGTTARLAQGEYRASIAVRNDSNRPANISAQIGLTFPPGGPNPGSVFDLVGVTLDPQQAVSFDCDELQDSLGLPAPYVQGFLTLSSRNKLDVSATQSVINPGTGVSISVRPVNTTRADD